MGNYNDFDLDIKKVQGENDIGPASITTTIKYNLQGTTQGNGLTGGVPPVRFSMQCSSCRLWRLRW